MNKGWQILFSFIPFHNHNLLTYAQHRLTDTMEEELQGLQLEDNTPQPQQQQGQDSESPEGTTTAIIPWKYCNVYANNRSPERLFLFQGQSSTYIIPRIFKHANKACDNKLRNLDRRFLLILVLFLLFSLHSATPGREGHH